MPPKPNPSFVEEKNITLTVAISKTFSSDEAGLSSSSPRPPGSSKMRLRICSSWAENCVSTPIIGEENLPWVRNEEKQCYFATLQFKFDVIFEEKENLISFHQNPGLYFFFTSISETTIQPIELVHLDCSSLLLQATELALNRPLNKEYQVTITIQNQKPLKPMEELLPYEPVILNLESLNNFPLYEKEDRATSLQNVYFYSSLKLDRNTFRPFFALPSIRDTREDEEPISTSSTPREGLVETRGSPRPLEDTFDLHQTAQSSPSHHGVRDLDRDDQYPLRVKFVLLPGLFDLSYFQDLLSSQTFLMQIHQEDFLARGFTPAVLETYMKLLAEEPGGLGLLGAAAAVPTLTKKGSTTSAATGAGSSFTPIPTTELKSDAFLIQTILSTLEQSAKVRFYGGGRFRLEQLLSKSNDLLTKFRFKRDPHLSTTLSDPSSPTPPSIDVRESLLTTIQLEKPSHPEKWDLPSDLSLKKALAQAKVKEDRLKEAKAASSSSSSSAALSPSTKKSLFSSQKRPPRHELFLSSQTSLLIKVKLFRNLDTKTSSYDSDLPLITTKMLQDPKLSLPASHNKEDLSRTVRINQEDLTNLQEDQLQSILAKTPFTRMIIRFPYQDDETLRAINEGMSEINHQALPNIQGTIRSYSLEPKEREEAIQGQLDLLSGVMILDDDRRLVILEGLAKPFGGIHRFYSDYLPKRADNTIDYAILCNPTILFPDRLYPDYCPDLKRIRIRGKLSQLSQRPEIYNHQQVSMTCFQAMDLLMNLLRLPDLRVSKLYEIYPSAEALNQLELLYGEAITRADMDGTLKKEFLETFRQKRGRRGGRRAGKGAAAGGGSRPGTSDSRATGGGSSRATTPMSPHSQRSDRSSPSPSPSPVASSPTARRGGISPRGFTVSDEEDEEEDDKKKRKTHSRSRRAKKLPETDCRNPLFEDQLQRRRNQPPKDYLREQQALRREAYLNLLYRREQRQQQTKEVLKTLFPQLTELDLELGNIPPVYQYANQKENYKAKLLQSLQEEMREQPNLVYTRSQAFISQTIPVIDEDRFQKEQNLLQTNPSVILNQDKSHWLTARGFQYPAPKTQKELLQHPKRPTETRIEDLKEPFYDATDKRPKGTTADHHHLSSDSLEQEIEKKKKQREQGFQTQFHLDGYFGALQSPRYETEECQLRLIGDPNHLPRGRCLNAREKNEGFFQSVFIGGEKQQQMMREAEEAEKKAWEAKVVVADKSFKVGHLVIHDKTLPFQRLENILHDPPQKQVLRDLYRHKGFENTPLSIFAEEPYLGGAGQVTIGREEHPEKFITATFQPPALLATQNSHSKTGNAAMKPLDFSRYLYHSEAEKEDLFSKIAKRKHPPLDRTNRKECSGPKWDPPAPGATSSASWSSK